MGDMNFIEGVKDLLASLGWWLFIRFQYNGDESKYFEEVNAETKAFKEQPNE